METSCGAGALACDYKHDRVWVRFPPEEMRYLIVLFFCCGVQVGNGIVLTLGSLIPLPTLLCVAYSLKQKNNITNITALHFFFGNSDGARHNGW